MSARRSKPRNQFSSSETVTVEEIEEAKRRIYLENLGRLLSADINKRIAPRHHRRRKDGQKCHATKSA